MWFGGQALPPPPQTTGLIGALNPNRGDAAFALFQGEADPLAFIQLAQARVLNGTYVYENIIPPSIRGNETIALAWVEPFHNTGLCGFWSDGRLLYRFHIGTFLTHLIQGGGHVLPDHYAGLETIQAKVANGN